MNYRISIVFGLLSLILQLVYCQSDEVTSASKAEIKGTPRIIHYSREDFKGDPQVWSMCQNDEGIMYFGNNDGVLIFDGARWHKITLPNNSSVRSLHYATDGKVYAGGFNEFGTIERDEFGIYTYQSLIEQLRPEERNLENLWAIHEVQNHIVLRSFSKLVALSGSKVFTIPVTNFYYSTVVNNKLILADDRSIKHLDLKTLQFENLILNEAINSEVVAGIIGGFSDEQIMIFTKAGSAFLYNFKNKSLSLHFRYLSKESNDQILSVIKSSGGNIYLGTLSSQIIVLDQKGAIIPIGNHFMELQDNTVLNLFESLEGNIWALLNNGIDCINISSPVSVLFENASMFDAMIRGGKIYAATNQGVFVSEKIVHNPYFASLKFQKINGLEGQAWSIQSVKDKILCSHDRGLFIIEPDKSIVQIPLVNGVWKVLPLRNKPNTYFVCTYIGIYLMEYNENKGFTIDGFIDGFNESSRDIIQGDEEGVFWVCHGYKGVFRIRLNKGYNKVVSVEHFRENGLPSPFSINVYRWKDEIVFTTNQGVYSFNEKNSLFVPHTELIERFGGDVNIRKLLTFEDKTWFVQDDEVGFYEDGESQLHMGLFLELKGTLNRGMECILPINTDNVLIGTTTGLYAYDLSYKNPDQHNKTLISEVSFETKKLRKKLSLTNQPAQLPFSANEIRIEFSSPRLKDQTQVQYSYLLSGMDETWSEWTTEPHKEYTRLFPGNYEFKAKARSVIGETSAETSFQFIVLPVWYLTKWAFAGYGLAIIGLVLGSRRLVKNKISIEKEKTRNEEQKKHTVLELELKQIRLERENERIEHDKKQLEEDVIFKSKELANYTMLLVRKRELLTELREDLKNLKEVSRNEKSRNMLRNLVRKIGIHLNDEEHIHVFEANFERVHYDFFQELKNHFPDLTAKELRLCALVKMNLTNKEIAPILNISLRGVETARYRLRKRLSLDHDDNMVEFLEKLSP